MKKSKLYYIFDPMCSWCYAFANVFNQLKNNLSENIEIIYVLGGLAKDSNETMPKEMQEKIESIWYEIENSTGTKFNHDFWTNCRPQRSTYNACRAVIIARNHNLEAKMIEAIQNAYYLNAKNPSEIETLASLASEIGINKDKFTIEIKSDEIEKQLQEDLNLRRKLKIFSFPTLLLQYKKEAYPINLDFKDYQKMLDQIEDLSSNQYF